jgi:Tfp pilus assembly protein PilN
MLRTNLSTRPFYNERGVHLLLGLAAALVLALTVFNLTQIVVLSRRQSELSSHAETSETRATELRARAIQTRQAVNTKQLEAVSGAAQEANDIIGQRLFSWTDLLNQLEATLPDEVRIAALRPRVERDGTVTVQINVTGRTTEDINEFIENLEATPAFSDVFPRDDVPMEGLIHATVEAKYATTR